MKDYLLCVLLLTLACLPQISPAQSIRQLGGSESAERQIFTFEPKSNETIVVSVEQLHADALITLAERSGDAIRVLSKHDIPKHNFFDEVVYINRNHCRMCVVIVEGSRDIDKHAVFTVTTHTLDLSNKSALLQAKLEAFSAYNAASAAWYEAKLSETQQSSRFVLAQRYFKEVVKLAKTAELTNLSITSQYFYSFASHMLNDYNAQSKQLEVLSQQMSNENEGVFYAVEIDRAIIELVQDRLITAEQRILSLINRKSTKEDSVQLGSALQILGRIYNSQGEFTKAINVLEKSLTIFYANDDLRNAITNHINLSNAYRRYKNRDKAKQHLLEAKLLAQITLEKRYETQADIGLATLFRLERNYQGALFHINQAQRYSKRYSHSSLTGRVYLENARIASVMGQYEYAADLYQDASKAFVMAGEKSLKIDVDYYMSSLLIKLNRVKEAKVHGLSVLDYDRQHGNNYDLGTSFNRLAAIEYALGNLVLAKQNQDEAIRILASTEDDIINAGILAQAGDIYFANGLILESERFFSEALDLYENSANIQGLVSAKVRYAKTLFDRAKYTDVVENIEPLIERLLNDQLTLTRFDHKRTYLTLFQELTGIYTLSALAIGHSNERVLQYVDALRAKSYALNSQHTVNSDVLQPLLLTMHQHIVDYAKNSSKVARDSLLKETRAISAKLHGSAQSETKLEEYNYSPALVDIKALQQMLPDKTKLVYFDTSAEKSHMWLLSRSNIEHVALPGESKIQADIKGVVAEHSRRPTRRQAVNWVSEKLLELSSLREAVALIELHSQSTKRLIVLPDGPLHYLPLELVLPSAFDTRTSVTYASSLSTLVEQLRDATQNINPLNKRSLALMVTNPTIVSDSQNRTSIGFVTKSLPFSKLEKSVFERVIGKEAIVLEQKEANKTRLFAQNLEQFDLLHFATHGIANPHSSALSGLVLSNTDTPYNVVLSDEIRLLKLNAELVVLSGCETANGEYIDGEGLFGLSQAFFDSGAKNVIASLWPVEDQATAMLMEQFYKAVFERDMAPEKALAEAKFYVRNFKKRNGQHPWAAPYYWAGFVFQGVGST